MESTEDMYHKIIPIQNAEQYFCVCFVVGFSKTRIPKYVLRRFTEKLE